MCEMFKIFWNCAIVVNILENRQKCVKFWNILNGAIGNILNYAKTGDYPEVKNLVISADVDIGQIGIFCYIL